MEMWKSIAGYEDLYLISSLGKVKSLPKGDGNGNRERILKWDITNHKHTSYARVSLAKEGKVRRFSVHRLVAEAFVANPLNKPIVNHLDNNALNNSCENLEWCTHQENMMHAQNQGRLFKSQSSGGKKGSLTNLNKLKVKVTNAVGCTFNKWTILGPELMKRKSKHYFLCRCSCGTEDWKEVGAMLRLELNGCRYCQHS